MINIETIKFLELLTDLTESSKNGIIPFSEYGTKYKTNKDYIIFDDSEKEVLDDDGEEKVYKYPVVMSMIVDECHHDIISNYDNYCQIEGFEMYVREDHDYEDGSSYYSVEIIVDREYPDLNGFASEIITIENGEWYFVK